MIKQIFALRDNQIGTFSPPFFETHEIEAKRGVQQALKQEGSKLKNHPGDFDLYLLGTYDDTSGKMTNTDNPQLIINLSALITSINPLNHGVEHRETVK